LSTSTVTAATATGGATPDPALTGATAATGTIDKNAFLKLLVSQLRNQNPLNPADGTEFVTQLAGFSQLEQSISMAQDLSAIRKVLENTHPDPAAVGAAPTAAAPSPTTAAPPAEPPKP
jgi:flagellar basal-body rod modification protein FlgD